MGISSSVTEPASERARQAASGWPEEIRMPNALTSVPDSAAGSKTASNAEVIDDEWFITNLKQLRSLSGYIVQEGIHVEIKDGVDPLDLRTLNRLRAPRAPSERGRSPKNSEWEAIDLHRRLLFGSLTPAQRRRFTLSTVPSALAWLPLVLGFVAFLAMTMALITAQHSIFGQNPGPGVFIFYLIWLMSLGAIGAVTFIGINALSVQEDAALDITKWQSIMLRTELGALFALVFTLPFGFQAFVDFCADISTAIGHATLVLATVQTATAPTIPAQTTPGDAWNHWAEQLTLVAPFVFGFGTSLVIFMLNRHVTRRRSTEWAAWVPTRVQRESTGLSAFRPKRLPPDNSSVDGAGQDGSPQRDAAMPRSRRRSKAP